MATVARLNARPSRPQSDTAPDPPLRRLHLNESPVPPSPAALAAMRDAAAEAHHYPDNDAGELVQALAARIGLPESRVVFGNGSSELLVAAAQIALGRGDSAVMPIPSFPLYAKAIAMQDAEAVGVPVREDGTMDVAATLLAIGPRCRLVYAATPNNPTGGLLNPDDVELLARGVPDTALLLLDEAYYEFGRHAGGPENLPILVRRNGPWLITRTFSKAQGLAGVRVGYGFTGTAALGDAIRNLRSNFNLNHVAQAGALAALEDEAYTRAILCANARERERLSGGLKALGFDPFPSATNFVTARAPVPAAALAASLREHGILIMALAWPGVPEAVRIGIGSADDTDAVLDALGEVLDGRT